MIASHVTSEILESAATKVGVRAEIRPLNSKGTRFNVKLYPVVTPAMCKPGRLQDGNLGRTDRRYTGEQGDAKYERESVGYSSAGRRVNAVCWHGFRDFFRAVYEQDSAVTFRTAVDTWKNAADFRA